MMVRTACLCLLIVGMLLWQRLALYQTTPPGTEISVAGTSTDEIILLPLDSRPPCRDFVVKAGKIAAVNVITPPHNLMDYYSYPGERHKLRAWLQENIADKRAVILSVDQLLYGGLLAAREGEFSSSECQRLLNFLRHLHRDNPNVQLYAFSVLPRLIPQDTIDGYEEKRALTEYSRLQGKLGRGISVDETTLDNLKQKISPTNLHKYETNFANNRRLNEELALLAQEGVLAGLVLGQDDGEPYSIGNLEKDKLLSFLAAHKIGSDQVYLMHGADEIAMLILANIIRHGDNHKVYIEYNDLTTPDTIMPFMAINMRQVAEERLRFLHLEQVSTPDEADFILVVSSINQDNGGLNSRAALTDKMKCWYRQNMPVALVDLSQHFRRRETLLPLLMRQKYPLNSLIAYAGWNTAGNAVGTALAESTIFLSAEKKSVAPSKYLAAIADNMNFVQDRILEDNLYLKDVIDLVNRRLKKAGYINTADLDLAHNYLWANAMLRQGMGRRIAQYRTCAAFRQPVRINSPYGSYIVAPLNLVADMSYPWPRTFEIYLNTVSNRMFAVP